MSLVSALVAVDSPAPPQSETRKTGDLKWVAYEIAYTAGAVVEPASDTGWLLTNAALLASDVAPHNVLFAKIGSMYNVGGEPANTFRLPDWVDGRIPIPRGISDFTTRGAKGGAKVVTLNSAQMPAHVHTASGLTGFTSSDSAGTPTGSISVTVGNHAHPIAGNAITNQTSIQIPGGSGGFFLVGNAQTAATDAVSPTGSGSFSGSAMSGHLHSVSLSGSIGSTGGGGSHENMPLYQVAGGILIRYL